MSDAKKRGLGRGLDALFKDVKKEEASFQRKDAATQKEMGPKESVQKEVAPRGAAQQAPVYTETKIKRADEMVAPMEYKSGPPRKLPVTVLRPGKFQPRRHFDEAAIDSLAESISVHGVLQPLLVRPFRDGVHYEIIAGERRWRASQKAQLHEVPVVIQEMSDNDALEIALIENLQREDLSALEEAEGYQRLMDEFRHTQDVLAHRLGKSRSHVTNMLRLLKLPAKVKKHLQDGSLTAGHARALVGVENADKIADVIVKRGLSVRQTEKLVKSAADGKAKALAKAAPKGFIPRDVDVMALEEKLISALGLKIMIDGDGPEGVLHIEYRSLDQLDDVVARLLRVPLPR